MEVCDEQNTIATTNFSIVRPLSSLGYLQDGKDKGTANHNTACCRHLNVQEEVRWDQPTE